MQHAFRRWNRQRAVPITPAYQIARWHRSEAPNPNLNRIRKYLLSNEDCPLHCFRFSFYLNAGTTRGSVFIPSMRLPSSHFFFQFLSSLFSLSFIPLTLISTTRSSFFLINFFCHSSSEFSLLPYSFLTALILFSHRYCSLSLSLPVYVSVPLAYEFFLENQSFKTDVLKNVNFSYKILVVSPIFNSPPRVVRLPICNLFGLCAAG
jgi:hypothetical protein